MDKLQEILGYRFKNQDLLKQALTHSSCTSDITKNYERLEFLGDRVLGVSMAHLLYNMFPQEPEGSLSPRFTKLVRKETVAAVALEMHLNEYIHAENQQLCTNINVLCDVAEAVIGAICIEAGFQTAIDFVDRHWQHLISQNSKPKKDSKTALQEISHAFGAGNPVYTLLRKEGSEHQPIFYIEASIPKKGSAIGSGSNKKIAEQEAAAALIAQLESAHG